MHLDWNCFPNPTRPVDPELFDIQCQNGRDFFIKFYILDQKGDKGTMSCNWDGDLASWNRQINWQRENGEGLSNSKEITGKYQVQFQEKNREIPSSIPRKKNREMSSSIPRKYKQNWHQENGESWSWFNAGEIIVMVFGLHRTKIVRWQ